MVRFTAAYGLTLAVFLAIDFIWLAFVARGFYADRLKPMLLDQPNLAAAGVFYALFAVGMVVFAVMPALKAESVVIALGYGALFGLIAYATYDLSNLATLRGWPIAVVVVDMGWGAAVSATSASLGYLLTRLLPIG